MRSLKFIADKGHKSFGKNAGRMRFFWKKSVFGMYYRRNKEYKEYKTGSFGSLFIHFCIKIDKKRLFLG